MNIQKSLELEIKTIQDQAVRYPELLNVLNYSIYQGIR